jgi:hypothetical protein
MEETRNGKCAKRNMRPRGERVSRACDDRLAGKGILRVSRRTFRGVTMAAVAQDGRRP